MAESSFRVVLIIALAAGCSKVTIDPAGARCDKGKCVQGYECHPLDGICILEIKRGCPGGGEVVCWETTVAGDACEGEGAYLPCGPAPECGSGCRTCADGQWSACKGAACTLGSVTDCAACGHDCAAEVDNATPACDTAQVPAACDYAGDCASSFFDADRDRSNGCECGPSTVEICNGIDDDCSGVADNMMPGEVAADCGFALDHVSLWQCTGACSIVSCAAGYHDIDGLVTSGCEYACAPSGSEACNGDDDDCDGDIDDDIPNLDGFCNGLLGNPVNVSAWACTGGACAIAGCQSGFAPGPSPADGCNVPCTPTSGGVEICDNIDNDCNGLTDEGLGTTPDSTCGDSTFCPITEGCDDGDQIDNGEGSCLGDCSDIQTCGDGDPEGTESCDHGPHNGTGQDFCLDDCSGIQDCGDGDPEGTEACDDGDEDDCTEPCLGDCSGTITLTGCGDGAVCGAESCDDGTLFSDCATCYGYRRPITILASGVTADLAEFPLLISIPDTHPAATDLAAKAQPWGDDLLFTASDGSTQLDHEIEHFDGSTGVLVAWVRIPLLSSTTDTLLYLYYGNSGIANQENVPGVWDGSYVGVWHLAEDPSADIDGDCGGTTFEICDSSSYGNHGDSHGAMTSDDLVSGKIGGAWDFEGTNDYVSVASSASLDLTGNQVTMEAWVRVPVPNGEDSPFVIKAANDNQERYMLGLDGGNDPAEVNHRVTTGSGHYRHDTGGILNDTWTYVAAVYNGAAASNPRFFMIQDGGVAASASNAAGDLLTTSADLQMAKRAGNRYLTGILDEIRVSNVSRPPAYFATCYANQNTPATFHTVGAEETAPW